MALRGSKLNITQYNQSGNVEVQVCDAGASRWIDIISDQGEFTFFFNSHEDMDEFIKKVLTAFAKAKAELSDAE